MSGPFGAGALQLFSAGDFFKHQINHSVRFNDSDSPYLHWTPSSSGNRRTWTLSFWFKRTRTWSNRFGTTDEENKYTRLAWLFSSDTTRVAGTADQALNAPLTASTSAHRFGFVDDSLYLEFEQNIPYGNTKLLNSYISFEDQFAWTHIVFRLDTTQSNAYERFRVYINGTHWTSSTSSQGNYGGWSYESFPALNEELDFNTASKEMNLGCYYNNGTQKDFFDGLIADVQFVDGISAGPTSFGEEKNDVWIPIEYAGNYGSNGFHLDFANSSDLGNDVSGNNNDWTASGITSADQMFDTPTRNYSTLTGNLDWISDAITFTEGNLRAASGTPTYTNGVDGGTSGAGGQLGRYTSSSLSAYRGKFYAEVKINSFQPSNLNSSWVGVFANEQASQTPSGGYRFSYKQNGGIGFRNQYTITGSAWSNGDIIGIAMNLDDGEITFYKNNVSQGTITQIFSKISGYVNGGYDTEDNLFQFFQLNTLDDITSTDLTWNFGQDSSFGGQETPQGNGGIGEDFKYTPPSGFKALAAHNLAEPSLTPKLSNQPSKHFDVRHYSGTGSAKSISSLNFTPDFTLLKNITSSTTVGQTQITDSVRGVTKQVYLNRPFSGDALDDPAVIEVTNNQVITSFNANGFSLGTESDINSSANTYLSYSLKAGGAAATNSAGTITSQVSASPSSGFSIVSYTGNATLGATVGHGLGKKPKFIMVKNLDTGGSTLTGNAGWAMYHKHTGGFYGPQGGEQYAIRAAYATSYINNNVQWWNDTAPTNTVFSLGNSTDTNGANDLIAYCFAEIEGFSRIGYFYNYGHDSTQAGYGRFFHLPFAPAMVLLFNITDGSILRSVDYQANGFNVTTYASFHFVNMTRNTPGTTTTSMNLYSNGFRCFDQTGLLDAQKEYVYIAFARMPLKYSQAVTRIDTGVE